MAFRPHRVVTVWEYGCHEPPKQGKSTSRLGQGCPKVCCPIPSHALHEDHVATRVCLLYVCVFLCSMSVNVLACVCVCVCVFAICSFTAELLSAVPSRLDCFWEWGPMCAVSWDKPPTRLLVAFLSFLCACSRRVVCSNLDWWHLEHTHTHTHMYTQPV